MKHVNLIAYAPNVQGPLVADVYYPVAAPRPSAAASAIPVNVWTDYSQTQSSVSSNGYVCPGILTVLSDGDTCEVPGIAWKYQTLTPNYGAGSISMVQLVYEQWKGTFNNCLGTCTLAGGAPPYALDTTFPYGPSVPTSQVWNDNDSPAYALAVGCGQC
jgi:hypothetical protein